MTNYWNLTYERVFADHFLSVIAEPVGLIQQNLEYLLEADERAPKLD